MLNKTSRILALTVAAAAATTVGLTSTAQASTTSGGCTVTPQTVRFYDYDSKGQKRVVLGADISCRTTRYVLVAQEGWEDDDKPSDRIDDHWSTAQSRWVLVQPGTTQHVRSVFLMPDTPHDGWEELYQKVRFKVQTVETYPVTSAWTGWESTPTFSMPN